LGQRAKVYLVGAGPGDPDLLTRKALRILESAEVVIYDRLVSAEILALANPDATFIYAGKHPAEAGGSYTDVQSEIFAWLLRLAHSVDSIVRLKNGDPMVLGRGGEELDFLCRHGFDVEVVPGVSSAISAPGLAGIPLTMRGVAGSFAVLAGHRDALNFCDWAAYRNIETLVVLMGVAQRAAVAARLMQVGIPPDRPVAFIERASTDRERIVETTLGAVALGNVEVEAPAVFVIGEVVRMRSRAKLLRIEEALS
jgi:uroporphyrin-III C-methyltransferase